MSRLPDRPGPQLPIDLTALEIPEALSLLVAWREAGRLEGGEIRVASEVAAHLRQACRATIERLSGSALRPYNADMHLESEEALFVSDPDLIAGSILQPVLFADHPLQVINARSLPDRALLLYAVTFLRGDGQRVAFVRKTNPRPSARPGRLFALLGNTLANVDKPVFTLEPMFDLVVTVDGLVAARQSVFELLFKETDAVLAAVPGWVEAIASRLPLAGQGAEVLAEMAQRSTRVRRRLQAIHERGHLAQVTIGRIRQHIRVLGLDEAEFIQNDQLVVDDTDPLTLLHLLNEDLFVGGLTDQPFRSERKSPRQQ